MNLFEYSTHYVKARDAFERKLKSIEQKGDSLLCVYKDREVQVVPQESLDSRVARRSGIVTVVTLQTQNNFDTLVKHFADFAANQHLTVLFANPSTNEKWLIKPAVHAAVADKASLKTGLLSLFQTVPLVDESYSSSSPGV